MRVVYEYSHLGGSEILTVRHPKISQAVDTVIGAVTAHKTKVSKEKTMKGELLYSPKDLNEQFTEQFQKLGFSELRDTYTITVPANPAFANYAPQIPGAFKQIDFVKERVLVEVQFGKYAFMFYDMAKFQYFFNENKADVGVEIVACHHMQSQMSSGVSYGEQLIYDIERLKRHFPAVPVKLILIDM
jgi:hypothetical protein